MFPDISMSDNDVPALACDDGDRPHGEERGERVGADFFMTMNA